MGETKVSLRDLIEAALDASIDKCARCKVCGNQVDAVMAAISAAVPIAAVAGRAPGRLGQLDDLVAAARAEGLRESDGDTLEAIVRRAYELGSKRAHEQDDGAWTVLGIWDHDEAIPVGAIRGRHQVYGESPGDRARTEPGFIGFDTESFYEQGVWATSVTAPDEDTAQDLAAKGMMREDRGEDEDESEEDEP